MPEKQGMVQTPPFTIGFEGDCLLLDRVGRSSAGNPPAEASVADGRRLEGDITDFYSPKP
jgi:hypothetical protein